MNNVDMEQKISDFMVKQKMPYSFKIKYAKIRAREFVTECEKRGLNYHVSVGGLDSITLLIFLRSIGIDCPAVSVSGLEDKSIQKIHKQLGVIKLLPSVRYMNPNGTPHRWSKVEILREFGFPIISKEVAEKIWTLANPTENNKHYRDGIMTRKYNSAQGVSKKWMEKFGGYANEEYGTNYKIPPFKVSHKCCEYLKERPCDDWARENNSVPFLGLMASEGGRRGYLLKAFGCNYFGKTKIRSCPFAIFSRQDLLQLALDLNVPIPEVYGTISRKEDGTLYTTKAQRTGCGMCGFGIHIIPRPNNFDILREQNPKLWHFWMYECCKDENGEKFGWARVLDYIGVPYLNEDKTKWDGVMQGRLDLEVAE